MNRLIYNMDNDTYHAHSSISSSNCKDLLKSSWAYQYKRDNPTSQTPSMAFGSMVHALILEADSFESRYFVADKPKRNTKEGKTKYEQLEKECAGRIWIGVDEYLKACDMTHNLNQSQTAKLLLSGGKAEVATFWQDDTTGTDCRAKCDYINVDAGYIVDIKTTSSLANENGFKSTVLKYQYHLSAAMYIDGFKKATGKDLDFYFIVLESAAPYNFAFYRLGDDLIASGRGLYRDALGVFERAKAQGNFKTPYHDGQLVELAA